MPHKIVILGCGLGGMLTALSFASKGIKTLILEPSDTQLPRDQRSIALTNYSKNFFEKIGIWKSFEPYAGAINNIYVLDNKASPSVHLSEPRGYMVEHTDLRNELLQLTQSNPLIDLKTEVKYETLDDGTIALDGNHLTPELIIVCDGRNSQTKQKYFGDFLSKSYGQSALIFFVRHEKPHEGTAVEHFMTRGPFAILPLQDPHKSSIVWVDTPKAAELYLSMSKEDFTFCLQERFGDFLGKVEVVSDIQTFPLSARITNKYFHKNMVVLGDLAHTIHPLAGQGLNQGIKDIEALTDIVSRNLSVGLDIDEIALEEYTNMRKADNYKMYLITDSLNRLFSNDLPIISTIRKIGLGIVDKLPALKRALIL